MADGFRQVETRLVLSDSPSFPPDTKIMTPDDAVNALAGRLKDMDREYCILVNLDSGLHPVNFHILTVGGINSASVPMEKVFQTAVLSNSAAILMLHNHPSGSLSVSASRSISSVITSSGSPA